MMKKKLLIAGLIGVSVLATSMPASAFAQSDRNIRGERSSGAPRTERAQSPRMNQNSQSRPQRAERIRTEQGGRARVRSEAPISRSAGQQRARVEGTQRPDRSPSRAGWQNNRDTNDRWNGRSPQQREWNNGSDRRNWNDAQRREWNNRNDRGRENDRQRREWNDRNDRRNWNNQDNRRNWNDRQQREWNDRQRREWQERNRYTGNNRAINSRYGHGWNQNWRNDRRYDWQRYRHQNQNRYRYAYYAPRGWDYGYRRFSIGVSIWSGLFASNYWINDPYRYRLPPAHGSLRWIRYYDDVLLVDVHNGYVVDIIHNFFW